MMFGKQVRDCVGWGIGESKADAVLQGLAQNVAGGSVSDESGGALWR